MHGFTAVFRKEVTQMLRDRGTLFFALVIPVFELILFGVIDMNAKNIPTVIFDQSRSQESRLIIDQFENTGILKIVGEVNSRQALQHAIVAGDAQVAVEIPPDYARKLAAVKGSKGALRCLKRRLSDAVFRRLIDDQTAKVREGQMGATLTSSAADLIPMASTSDKPLPGLSLDLTPLPATVS